MAVVPPADRVAASADARAADAATSWSTPTRIATAASAATATASFASPASCVAARSARATTTTSATASRPTALRRVPSRRVRWAACVFLARASRALIARAIAAQTRSVGRRRARVTCKVRVCAYACLCLCARSRCVASLTHRFFRRQTFGAFDDLARAHTHTRARARTRANAHTCSLAFHACVRARAAQRRPIVLLSRHQESREFNLSGRGGE